MENKMEDILKNFSLTERYLILNYQEKKGCVFLGCGESDNELFFKDDYTGEIESFLMSSFSNPFEKYYYVVHLHRIEESYSFGVFDSEESLINALSNHFKTDKEHNFDEEDSNKIYKINPGEEVVITLETNSFGWNIYIIINLLRMNQVQKSDY